MDEKQPALTPEEIEAKLKKSFAKEEGQEPPSPAEPSPDLVGKYTLFRETVHPKANIVYYPSPAKDSSPSFAFPDSRVVYVDIDKRAVAALQEAGLEAHCESALEFDPGTVDILIMLNPAISPTVPSSHVSPGGYVLCNNYHGTASSLRESGPFEFRAIIRPSQDQEIIYDTGELDDCWREVETEEEFKHAPFTWDGVDYHMAAVVVKAVTGKEENVLEEYKKILDLATAQTREKDAKYIEEHPEDAEFLNEQQDAGVLFYDFEGRQFTLPTHLPKKKGTADDIFVFRKKEPIESTK